MPGFSNITGLESIMYADNASFDGTERGGKMTTDGQVWIGASSSPYVRLSTLTSGNNITFTNGPGSITANVTGTSQYAVQVGSAAGALTSLGTGSAGQILQSGGAAANPAYSTATYPSTAGTSGNVLTSDGTNWVSSTPLLQYKTFTLTSAQIKSLNATPIEVIAAPGADKILVLVSLQGRFNYGGSNVFVAAVNQTIVLTYNADITFAYTAVANATITASGNKYINGSYTTLPTGYDAGVLDNQPFLFWQASATEISGNAANNNDIDFYLTYYVADLNF